MAASKSDLANQEVAAPANFLDWRERVQSFQDVAAYVPFGETTLTGDGPPRLLSTATVTGNFFRVLGASPALGRLFGIRGSDKLREHYLGAGAFGLVPRFEGSVQYDDLKSAWKTSIVNLELAKGFMVQRAWVDDEQYGMINELARGLGDAFAVTREVDAADVFNKAFTSTTYRLGDANLGGDGVVLCSASHPLSPVNAGSVQSNTAALPLTMDNFELVRNRMAAWTDDRSQLLGGHQAGRPTANNCDVQRVDGSDRQRG